jgi:hypothetical protein
MEIPAKKTENRVLMLWPDGGAEGARNPDLLNAIQQKLASRWSHLRVRFAFATFRPE